MLPSRLTGLLIVSTAFCWSPTAMANSVVGKVLAIDGHSSPESVSVWFTGASGCTNGGPSFSVSATQDQKNRFWSMVLTAKALNRRVGIYYTSCVIDSFYMEN